VRADHLVHHDTSGRAHLIVTSPDAPFVVSAYIEHGSHAGWHFGYARKEQEAIARLVASAPELRRALLFVWFDAVDPYIEGRQPAAHLDLTVGAATGWALFPTDEHEDGHPVTLLTMDEHRSAANAVRLGHREIYADRPLLPAARIRAAGTEYIRTGRLPTSLTWQKRAALVPQGPFGRQLVPDHDLPPKLDWTYPKRAQQWAYDPPSLYVS
jgi:hypothetical protein